MVTSLQCSILLYTSPSFNSISFFSFTWVISSPESTGLTVFQLTQTTACVLENVLSRTPHEFICHRQNVHCSRDRPHVTPSMTRGMINDRARQQHPFTKSLSRPILVHVLYDAEARTLTRLRDGALLRTTRDGALS